MTSPFTSPAGSAENTIKRPRDEWVVGYAAGGDGKRREYVVHLVEPRFSARVLNLDEEGDPLASEEPYDLKRGHDFGAGAFFLCEIDWIDQPEADQTERLLEAAADVVFASG